MARQRFHSTQHCPAGARVVESRERDDPRIGAHVIDELAEARGILVAVGCCGTNFKTGPGIGKCLAEWATAGAAHSVDLHPFRATRFTENEPVTGSFEYGEGAADVWR